MATAIRWTPEHLQAYLARTAKKPEPAKPGKLPIPAQPGIKPRSKYASKKVEQDGITFDSAKEARRWAVLEQLQKAGQISELQRQVAFVLAPAVRLAGEARMKPALRYVADAVYVENGQTIIEDTKSPPTRRLPIYRCKKHLLKTVHGLDIREI